MPNHGADLAAGLAALLPPNLTPEQRERYGAIFAIVKATTDALAHPRNEFVEPAAVFDMQERARCARP